MDTTDSRTSDALIPGAGNHPSYGIQESSTSTGVGGSTSISTEKPASIVRSAMHSSGKERIWAVAWCCLTACMASIVTGMMLGYSSATLVELELSSNPDQKIIANSTTGSLFGSFGAVGALFGGFLAWPVTELFGRQATLMIGGVPSLIGWLFLTNAHMFESNRTGFLAFLYVGRLLTGFASGWSMFSVSVYIAETASAKLKGLFGNCNQLFVTIGVFLAYGFGSINKLTYYHIALIAAGVIAIFEFLMLFTYETPRWLYSKGKDLKGNKVLNVLRGPNANIHKEITNIKKVLRKRYTLQEQLLAFKERATYLPFIIVMMLMFFQQFGGINAAVFYAGPILSQAGFSESTSKLLSTFAVGLVQIVATFISVVLIDILGRRILLTTSSVGMILSTLMLGTHFYIVKDLCHDCLSADCMNNTNYPEPPCGSSNIGALAVTGYIIFIASFSLGWGPIPWTAMSELLPLKVRALAGSIATLFNWLCASIVTLAFQDFQQAVTPKFAWWSFCFVLVIGTVFVVLFLPETKGHTLEEIQENFEQGHIFAISFDRCRGVRRRGAYSEIK